MSKFGWKCFLGSFIFSLAAVFAATKAYMNLAQKEKVAENIALAEIKTKEIELFAQNEETDALYEKVNQITNETVPQEETAANTENAATETEIQTAALSESAGSAVLYAPDDEDETDDIITAENAAEIQTAENSTFSGDIIAVAQAENDMADESEFASAEADIPAESEFADEKAEPMVLADASQAQAFTIPLKHNFTAPAATVTVSSKAETSQIALASASVALDNLGTENQASVTEPLQAQEEAFTEDSPWEVAEVSNAHITRNKLESFSSEHRNELSALDKNQHSAAQSDNETEVAYKMMKNLLIPIPEDIMNDENLTPNLVYSDENKKLSENMQKQNLLPKEEPKTNPEPESTAAENIPEPTLIPENEAQTSKSLTESIAAWFSNTENKSATDNIAPPKDVSTADTDEKKDENSVFGRLLNLGQKNKKSSIAPSELKLAFQPNRAEISGQTLEWLHAFSQNAIKNENVFIEIRIDNSNSQELQQKRLNLLYSILINNGVDFSKINIIFTAREPNSFIIRNVRYASEEDIAKAKRNSYSPWY